MEERDELRRTMRGAEWGAAAALVMGLFLAGGLGSAMGLGGPRRAFPILIAEQILGRSQGAGPILLGFFAHFVYGALAGGAFAYFSRPMTVAKGIGFGVFLWWIMQITFVPWLGLRDFGLLHGMRLALGSLIVHLAYGLTLGFLGAHDESSHHAHYDDLGRLSSV